MGVYNFVFLSKSSRNCRTCGFLFLCRLTHKLFIHHKMSVSGSLKRFIPLFDRILVQRAEAMTKTKGGIIIPEKSQGKVLEGTVVAAGPGARNDKGDTVPMSIRVGDTVLLPEYGGTKLEIESKEYSLLRESDIMAKFAKE